MSSVYKRYRHKSKIDFYYNVNRLNEAVQEMVENPKWYAKHQTFRRAIPIMELCRELVKEVCTANENLPQMRVDYSERRVHQTRAIGLVESVLQEFKVDCDNMGTIPSSQKRKITALCVEVKSQLIRWKKSDYRRFKDLR